MRKIHTRLKRKFGLNGSRNVYSFFHPGTKISKPRPRTFATVDSAKNWAAKNGLVDGTYTIDSAKSGKRYKVVTSCRQD